MYRVKTRSRVERDGVVNLHLTTPLPVGEVDVDVSIAPVSDPDEAEKAWNAWVDEVFGSIDDPTFVRPPQGQFETRESLD